MRRADGEGRGGRAGGRAGGEKGMVNKQDERWAMERV